LEIIFKIVGANSVEQVININKVLVKNCVDIELGS